MEKMTIEEELELRAKTAQFLLDLLEDLKRSMAFFIEKCNFAFRNQLSDQMVFYQLLGIVNKEMSNIIHQCEPSSKMVETSLLPVCERPDVDSLEEAMQRVILLLSKDSDLREAPHSKRYCSISEKLLTNLHVFRHFNVVPSKDEEAVFASMLCRYKEEHKDALHYYVEDCSSLDEGRAALRRDYKGVLAVDSWNNHGRDIKRTIKDLAGKQAVEKDLMPLIEYISKYDALSLLDPHADDRGSFAVRMAAMNGHTVSTNDDTGRNTYNIGNVENLTVNSVDTLNNVNMDVHDNTVDNKIVK